jgi:hypothetical protein
VEMFGKAYVLPNNHTGRHFREREDLYTLMRYVSTKPVDTRHLGWKRLIKKMNCKNVERDLMEYEQARRVIALTSQPLESATLANRGSTSFVLGVTSTWAETSPPPTSSTLSCTTRLCFASVGLRQVSYIEWQNLDSNVSHSL